MISLRNKNLKKVKDLLDTPKAVRRVREGLEKKTEEDFRKFLRSKRNARALSQNRKLD